MIIPTPHKFELDTEREGCLHCELPRWAKAHLDQTVPAPHAFEAGILIGRKCGRCDLPEAAQVHHSAFMFPNRPAAPVKEAVFNCKPTNPKDAIGSRKPPTSTVSAAVTAELGLAMLEGACKYGRHNYRDAGVRASVYYDAMNRHMAKFWEGEDIDKESGMSHVVKAIACLYVLRDSMIQKNWVDDRPPKTPEGFWEDLAAKTESLLDKFPEPKAPFTEKGSARSFQPERKALHDVMQPAGTHRPCACPQACDKHPY